MSSLALMFIILPFTLLGFFYVAALLSYELAPRVSALPGHLRAALAVWVGYSLLVSFSLYTAYSPGAAVAGFLLTFFAVPALFVLTGYVVGRAGGWIDSASEVLDDGDAIGFSLFWSVSVTLAALAVEGPGAIGVALVIALVIPFGCFVLGWSLYAMACAVGVVRSATQRFNSMALRARFWGAVEAAGLVRSFVLYQSEARCSAVLSQVRDMRADRAGLPSHASVRALNAIIFDRSARVSELEALNDVLASQLVQADPLVYGGLLVEVDRAADTSARIDAVRVAVSPALPYISPRERFALSRALEG
jgi:hypothetical protein